MVSSNEKKKIVPAPSQGSQDQKRHEENIHHNFKAKTQQEKRVAADQETQGRLHNEEYNDVIDDLEESYGPHDDDEDEDEDEDEDFDSKKR